MLVSRVKNGSAKSCGCYQKEILKLRTTHDKRHSKEYLAWCNMKARCYNPSNNRYSTYGAVGITVCDEWRKDFAKFYSDMGDCPEGCICRKDTNGNYNKENCMWSTNAAQIRKRTNAHIVTINGKSYNVRDAEVVLGIHRSSINQRHRQTGETYQQVTNHFLKKKLDKQISILFDCHSLLKSTHERLAA